MMWPWGQGGWGSTGSYSCVPHKIGTEWLRTGCLPAMQCRAKKSFRHRKTMLEKMSINMVTGATSRIQRHVQQTKCPFLFTAVAEAFWHTAKAVFAWSDQPFLQLWVEATKNTSSLVCLDELENWACSCTVAFIVEHLCGVYHTIFYHATSSKLAIYMNTLFKHIRTKTPMHVFP